MNNNLGIGSVMDLLDRLKTASQDFAAGKESANSELKARTTAELRAFQRSAQEQQAALAERVTQAEANAQAAEARAKANHLKRKVRINEAHKRLRRKASEDVSLYEGNRKQKLQTAAMDAEKRRDSGLATAVDAHEEFKAKLVESEHAFLALEKKSASSFRGYGKFKRLLAGGKPAAEPDLSGDEYQLFAEIERIRQRVEKRISNFRKKVVPAFFRFLPIWLLVVLFVIGFGAAPELLKHFGGRQLSYEQAGIGAAICLGVFLALYFLARGQSAAEAKATANDLLQARRLHEVAFQKAETTLQLNQERIKNDYATMTVEIDQQYKDVIKEAINLRDLRPRQLDEKAAKVSTHHERWQLQSFEQLRAANTKNQEKLRSDGQDQARQFAEDHQARMRRFQEDRDEQMRVLEKKWTDEAAPLLKLLEEINARSQKLFPAWDVAEWKNWEPPLQFENTAKFGTLELDLETFAGLAIGDQKLPRQLTAPLALTYPGEGSIIFETGKTGQDEAIAAINDIIFRLLATTPPGKLSFTIFDPVGLGQNFAGIMHLADYDDSHTNSRIWTQPGQMEEKLGELNEHMEKVIQMYLRNEYETIAEYNAQAGAIAEKYHFLVIASFPSGFSDTAAKRLRNIAASGARCGVYTLIHWDRRQPLPQDFVPDELRKNSVCLVHTERGFELSGRHFAGGRLLLEAPPSPEFATQFLHRIGELSKNANRVEVPFSEITPDDNELWKEETAEELRVPIGRSGATKLQYLAIGKGTRQHALIAGKTGSGKSTLFHVIITNLALWCSPEQVEFYLVDFKKGVEFKCYASRQLPHGRVVAIESDRQFGLSVLERVDAELRKRGDLFRKLGVQDIPGYKRAGGKEKMPRSLLMIDEFQEFFTEEDRISQAAAVLLDRIVRQGRAFGIHVILGSQTLGGAYTLARATLGQMVIRIALQCNEADAYLIMDQDNPAPRLLSRPGEGIYNDAAGAIEGNSPFQAVWIGEDVRDEALATARRLADQNGDDYPGPFVFEGNAPADVRENQPLNTLLRSEVTTVPSISRIWLGAPNSIKGPTEVAFQRQGGNNLMVVGQNEESTLAMLAVTLVSLASQFPPGAARIILLDSTVPGSPQAQFLEQVIQAIPQEISRPKGTAGITETMAGLSEELKRRSSDSEAAENGLGVPTFLVIHGLEHFKKLRQEDEFAFSGGDANEGPNPAAVLQTLITEGPSHGIHLLLSCDSFNNISRFLGRKALSEFSTRVLFQMSASDSAALIDAPDAGTLGLHRALLYNDREGYSEIFRPYARPGNEWLEQVGNSRKERRTLIS